MAGKRGGRNSRARSPRAGTNNSDSNSNRQNGNIKNKKKKDVLKRERTRLDDVLTVIFVLLVLSVFYHVRDDREWMLTLIASLASVAVVIFASKTLFRGIGGFISDRLLNSSWTLIDDRRPLRKKQTMKKFTDQAWQFIIHTSMAIMEFYLVFVDTEGGEQNFFDNTTLCWFWKGENVSHSRLMQLFYVVQLSIWIVTCFSHRFVEARHKDYYQMYVHHIATIALVAGSWINGYLRIGVLVLLVHDTSDIPLDLTKMLNYLKLQGPRGFFLAEAMFVVNLFSWAYCRLFLFPTKCLYSAFVESGIEAGITPTEFLAKPLTGKLHALWELPGSLSANILLNVLLLLHIYWFVLLIRIAYKIISGVNTHKVGEEEYEGASTDNDD